MEVVDASVLFELPDVSLVVEVALVLEALVSPVAVSAVAGGGATVVPPDSGSGVTAGGVVSLLVEGSVTLVVDAPATSPSGVVEVLICVSGTSAAVVLAVSELDGAAAFSAGI